MTELVLIDPELAPRALRDLAGANQAVATFFNPLQRDALADAELIRTSRGYGELRDGFDAIHWGLLAARQAGVSRTPLDGVETHEIDLAAVLEVGFATEIHIVLASHFEHVSADRVRIRACRSAFAQIARAYAAHRGWAAETTMLTDAPVGASSRRRRFADLAEVASELAGWQHTGRKKVYSVDHRQTRPLLTALRSDRRFAVATPRLAAAVGIGTGRITRPRPAQIDEAKVAMRQLRAFVDDRIDGYVRDAWATFCDVFEAQLGEVLTRLSRTLGSLDILQPDFVLAPSWSGVEPHALRAWTHTYGVPFAVLQHGFNIGSRFCSRFSVTDADIYYTWSDRFVVDWIDTEHSPHCEFVSIGNPAYDGVHARPPRAPRSIMIAPSGVLEFGRERLFDFWRSAFAMTEEHPDIRWKIRPHVQSRNDGWVRRQSDALGLTWSRDEEPDVSAALRDTDIVVTTLSTLALDAIMRGVLVVLVNGIGEPPLFIADCVAAYTERPEEVGELVDRLLRDPEERARAFARQAEVIADYSTPDVIQRLIDDIDRRT